MRRDSSPDLGPATTGQTRHLTLAVVMGREACSGALNRASYEVTARTVKFLGKREGSGGAPTAEPPLEGYEEDDSLPF